ncbi:hypothetical protein WOLCODRAFT_157556 [Wolfiporia cocos MD-104 SS10]|uniref:F-box domain-containing protein n=1 Tax=Wolfiporia cocos (strain MD-104) TaxID=742152 RepID=A0A2H3J3V6_WOLCO|nr:hypothetical protein WOLCODRAFT_157556 [Wolfiporia cocos MD-104 SS10]
MAKASAAKRQIHEAAAAQVREGGQDHADRATTIEGAGTGQEVRSDSSSALQKEAQDRRAIEQTTRENSAVKSEVEGESAPSRKSTRESAEEAQEVKRVLDPALTGSDPSSKTPPQLPTEVCERIIDWLWEYTWMLWRCALVCKAWTPRCRYQMQRNVTLYNRSHVQGHARRARAQLHLLQQARSVSVWGEGERAPIPHLGTFAMMAAAKLPLMWRLDILDAIWKLRDFHPLIFVHLSAFSSVTTLRLYDVTFPKVREFGRLVCALPSLVRLKCYNMLFTSTAPCASLAITHCPPSVRLTDLVISSFEETSSSVEANIALIGHLCAVGVVTDLQRFEFSAWASSDSEYLEAFRESLYELFKQCSWSLHNVEFSLSLRRGKDNQTDAISDTIASVLDLMHCDSLETVALEATNFEEIGYSWMFHILESNVSKKLCEVSIVMNEPEYNEDADENLQRTVSALRKDMCSQLDELFSNKDYEKLHHVDFMFKTHPDQIIPDATRWSTLLKAGMQKLDERGVLRTHVDVLLDLWDEDAL